MGRHRIERSRIFTEEIAQIEIPKIWQTTWFLTEYLNIFWLNILTSTHKVLTHTPSLTMKNPEKIPEWLAKSITYLLPKANETTNPKNHRPIICLSTTYKLLTSIILERTYSFLEQQELVTCKQKGCQKGSYWCKDQLLINRMIIENCHKKKRSLRTAWIDYCKAFNSVPHSWILEALDIYKVLPVIINFLKIVWSYGILTCFYTTLKDLWSLTRLM